MANDPKPKAPDQEGDLELLERKKVARPRRYKVVLHNDDYTTMEFVIEVLIRFFHKEETEAMHIMLNVHHKGSGVCGLYSKDIAETKVAQVLDFARERAMPLMITAEPE
jgi:ATP-dependent Clp protease adaptor protein ClpS